MGKRAAFQNALRSTDANFLRPSPTPAMPPSSISATCYRVTLSASVRQ